MKSISDPMTKKFVVHPSHPLKASFALYVLPTLLVAMGLLTIFAVELVVRLQIILNKFGVVDESMLGHIRHLSAARELAGQVANSLSIVTLIGAIAFTVSQDISRWIRFGTLVAVICLLLRAYFWTVA